MKERNATLGKTEKKVIICRSHTKNKRPRKPFDVLKYIWAKLTELIETS